MGHSVLKKMQKAFKSGEYHKKLLSKIAKLHEKHSKELRAERRKADRDRRKTERLRRKEPQTYRAAIKKRAETRHSLVTKLLQGLHKKFDGIQKEIEKLVSGHATTHAHLKKS